ncbi:uncharacterized protein LOC114663017 [Erpetoichthys calabaricus]|uniref:uncharacterized protein LOC114663017 n=1 Tax=Erpetoichthys calabaricus TaxID=27687 RepID=UPI002234B457|nr:uncharacterized protein LOC114663017 [Erpetoichthys calabaricus]XP_028672623.2 uncharacterized protein LOC114663017 [Erpetoichthys calabaricus]XP_051790417.1 uncharacterized protein LOC114663017 [Erpetoichthys calabaricus]
MDDTCFLEMTNHLHQLEKIRNTPELRTNLIYQKFSAPFLKTFSEHQEALEECLGKIEEIASAMDTVKRNVSIVSVSTGTVGIAGGVLCIIGLVLTPVTLGVSSILSIVGTAVGAGAGVGDLVTNITEGACNAVKKNKVEEILNKYKKTIEPIDESLRKQELVFNKVSEICKPEYLIKMIQKNHLKTDETEMSYAGIKAAGSGVGLGKAAVNMADDIANLTRIGDTVSDGAAVGLRGTGTGALKIMGGVGSSVFIVWDLYRICTNSISLAKGKKNETAEIIRRTVAELRRELQSYKHLYEVLQKGKEDAINNQKALAKDFIPQQLTKYWIQMRSSSQERSYPSMEPHWNTRPTYTSPQSYQTKLQIIPAVKLFSGFLASKRRHEDPRKIHHVTVRAQNFTQRVK